MLLLVAVFALFGVTLLGSLGGVVESNAGETNSHNTTGTAPDVTVADEALDLEAGPGQTIYGDAELPVGTNLTLSVTLVLDDQSFEYERTTAVTANEEFYSVFDLSSVAPNTTVAVTLERDGDHLVTETTTLASCQRACEEPADDVWVETEDANLSFETGPGRVVTADTSLPAGTTVDIVVRSTHSTGLSHTTATVDASGTVYGVVDLSEIDVTGQERGELSLRERQEGSELVEQNVTLTPYTQLENAPEPDFDGRDGSRDSPQFVGELADRTVTDIEDGIPFGETVLIPIDTHGADAVQVEVRGGSFDATVSVADRTGDGRVTVAFDTHPTGGTPVFFSAEPGDTVTVEELSGALTPTHLTLELDVEGETVDRTVLSLTEQETTEPSETDMETSSTNTEFSTPPLIVVGMFALAFACATAGLAILTGVVRATDITTLVRE